MTEIEKTQPIQEIKVTSENLPELCQKIASLREEKGKEGETSKIIRLVRKEAIHLKEYEGVVDLYWEDYLVHKHRIMSIRDEEGLGNLRKKFTIGTDFLIMKISANMAERYINDFNIKSRKPRSGRFLGEIAMFEKKYEKAINYFEKSIELYMDDYYHGGMKDWFLKANALEISGFLAEALILSGRPETGIRLTKKNFAEYDKKDGKKLKKNDYYTWAVWKSGLPIKAWHAILAKGISFDEDEVSKKIMVNMLNSAEKILVIPEEQKTWGDKNFEFRKNEIKAIKKSAGIQ